MNWRGCKTHLESTKSAYWRAGQQAVAISFTNSPRIKFKLAVIGLSLTAIGSWFQLKARKKEKAKRRAGRKEGRKKERVMRSRRQKM